MSAQVRAGDLLLNNWNPPALRHYRADGSLVAEVTAPNTRWAGAAIDPAGRWYTSVRGTGSSSRLQIFEGDGTPIRSFPVGVGTGPGDVSLFADGTIAICDTFGYAVHLYDSTGAFIMFLSPSGMGRPTGSLVDRNDELWVCDSDAKLIWHFDNKGTLLGALDVSTTSGLGDVDMAPDGTLWTVLYNTGEARNYATDGTLIRSFQTSLPTFSMGTAV
ncbi:MAG: hypothetical protein GY711_10235, partial [bacterium]|nr:hypothetical protein [bacterium]